jgi:alginate production protein
MTLLVMLVLLLQGRLGAAESETQAASQEPVVDLDAPPERRLRVTPVLRVGAEITVEGIGATNLDLDATTTDDRALVTPEVALAVLFEPRPSFTAFLDVELVKDITLTGPDESPKRVQFALKEAFVAWTDVLKSRIDLRIGRQQFDDEREWLFDAELDAVRVGYHGSALTLDGAVSRRELVPRELFHAEVREAHTYYLLMGRYAVTTAHTVGAYGLLRDDRSPTRDQSLFLGLHAYGTVRETVTYWVELAHVRGREGPRTLRGYGVDLGITSRVPLPWQPALTVGVAFGSGDTDPAGRVDRSFRQTGLHDNEGTWAGVAKFKYYGELLDPELSNLLILTGGIGLRPTRTNSLDLVAHAYLQHTTSHADEKYFYPALSVRRDVLYVLSGSPTSIANYAL